MNMFCYQCQETARGQGCTMRGVCGKTAEVAQAQDLLIYTLKGLAFAGDKAEALHLDHSKADAFIMEGLFSTITNVNFDQDFFLSKVKAGLALRDELKQVIVEAGCDQCVEPHDVMTWSATEKAELEEKAKHVGILETKNEDVRSLRELIIYGLKGLAAYADHANILGYRSAEIFAFVNKALAATINDNLAVPELINLVLETGKYGVDVMALLDKANTESYGHPELTKVNIGVRNNPGILISGHDLKDMEELLEQTKGTGVDVYTHGEMLPANYYPAFKKYEHFVGNYGNAWWQQNKEFESFNGPILMTTNCLVPPKDSYKDRVYTTGVVGFPGVKHIADRVEGQEKDFSAMITHAKQCVAPIEIERGEIIGGFAHNQVFALADKVVDAVKSGAIKKFFVMAGCDGRVKSRSYYTEFAKQLPQDTVILTAGCAKYRYNKLELGDIGGIPRVLDAGQCNDSYSLVAIALKLKGIFGLDDVNDLPIAYNISWYEQKAVIVLLALLYLGVKNIHLGPTLPAFLSPNVVNVLVKEFGIAGITTVEDDMKIFLG